MNKVMRFSSLIVPSAIASLAILATGCGNDLDPGSRVTSFRVLAVSADKPYARPGEDVQLRALWYDPHVTERRRAWGWMTCVNPESTTVLGCFSKVVRDAEAQHRPPEFIVKEEQDTFTVKVPADALEILPPPARRSGVIGVVAVACPGKLTVVPNVNPENFELPFQCADEATGRVLPLEDYVAGIKRIFVRSTDRNANPTVAKVTWDGADWPETEVKQVTPCQTAGNIFKDCDGADKHSVAIVVTNKSFEEGHDEFGAEFHEQLVAQYYATEGIFEHEVRIASDPESSWVARSNASGKTLMMWLVARDNRGGVVWATRKVAVK